MSARRGSGDGSIYYSDKRGRWVAVADLGRDGTGKRRRTQATGGTRAEAKRKLDELLARAKAGVASDPRLTVGQWLDRWLTTLPGRVAPATEGLHHELIRTHLRPALGTKRLSALTIADCDALWSEKLGTYAPNTVRLMRATLRRALGAAEREGVVIRNVAALSEPVRVPPPRGRAMTVDQAKVLLATADGTRLHAVVAVGLALGLRRGELLGLRWADFDTGRGTLAIVQAVKREAMPEGGTRLVVGELKRGHAARTLCLPPQLVAVLAAHRKRQTTDRLAAGPAWQDSGLIFTNEIGGPVDPRNFYRDFVRLTELAGVGRWNPHTMRHSSASLMLALGVPLHVVSESLGHSSITITKDVYGHLTADQYRQASEATAGALFGAVEGRTGADFGRLSRG